MNRTASVLLFLITSIGVSAQEGSLEGIVKRSDGQPVLNALVAAIPNPAPERWAVAGSARSDANGAFRITGLAPGKYALTATNASLGAAFVEEVTVPAAPVTIAMADTGRRLRGTLRTTDGKPYRGRVLAGRISSFEGDLFVLETDDDGRFNALIPAARYVLGTPSRDTVLDTAVDLRESDASLELSLERSFSNVPPAVVSWLQKDAIRLKTVVAGNGFEDMQPLKRVVGNARLVALGEATHGTREFFQLKHRMLEFLVAEMGFTVFGIEASMPDTVPVNQYVLHGKGDPAQAVAGMGFWTWNTEEVLEMVKWMRAYNEDARHPNKLRFHGFDMQNPRAAVAAITRYLQIVDPDTPLTSGFRALTDGNIRNYAKTPPGQAMVRAAIGDTVKRFESNRAAYIAKSSAAEWTWVRRQLDLIGQADEMFRSAEDGGGVRDRAMAENVKWLLDQEPAGTKMVIWAHNGHVTTETHPFFARGAMGRFLRRMYGDDMRVFGFAFARGRLQAVKRGGGGLTQHTAPPPRAASFDAALLSAGAPMLALNLRSAPPEVRDWLQAPLQHRSIGAVYSSDTDSTFWIRMRPLRSFDAILFVADTTASKGLGRSGGSSAARTPPPAPAAAAVNLDFEDGEPGAKPKGWTFPRTAEDAGFRVLFIGEGRNGSTKRRSRRDESVDRREREPVERRVCHAAKRAAARLPVAAVRNCAQDSGLRAASTRDTRVAPQTVTLISP